MMEEEKGGRGWRVGDEISLFSLHCCSVCVKKAITLTKETKSFNSGIQEDNAATAAGAC